MTEQTQTEKLQEQLGYILGDLIEDVLNRDMLKPPSNLKEICVGLILKASKEAGLIWIDFEDGNPELWHIEEIEID